MNNLIQGLQIVKKYQKYNELPQWECVDNLISCRVCISKEEDIELMKKYGWFQNGAEYWSLGDSLLNCWQQ